MRTVYDAAHGAEAQIVADLLAGEGIEARVDGSGLVGAVGELPAVGLVKVRVPDADVARARAIIAQWQATEVEPEDDAPVEAPQRRKSGAPMFLLGVLVGGGLMFSATRYEYGGDSVDYDLDGRADLQDFHEGTFLSRTFEDRNRDGNWDGAVTYDRDDPGTWTWRTDDDFDGRYENTMRYRNGIPTALEVDADRDGKSEYVASYHQGVLVEVRHRDAATDQIAKREHYEGGWLVRSEIDTDADGHFDLERTHDRMGEIMSFRKLPQTSE